MRNRANRLEEMFMTMVEQGNENRDKAMAAAKEARA
jgi:ABC-2 type transport system ATP-binding protein